MSRLPPLRALQAFEALGRLGSVTRAAIELGVTPGAVSQQIRKAEGALGIRLVERSGASIELTSLGRLYHGRIVKGFDMLRGAQEVLQDEHGRSIVISCLPSIAIKWLGPRLIDWQAAHTGATIRLTGDETEPRLAHGTADFRISYGPAARAYENTVELFTDEVVPVCSFELLQRHPVQTPSNLLALPRLDIEWGDAHRPAPDWKAWARAVSAEYDRRPSEMAFSLSSAAIDAAINGRGCVMAQISMVGDDIAAGRLVIPFDHRLALPDPYFLAWSEAALDKPFGAELKAWLIDLGRRQVSTAASP